MTIYSDNSDGSKSQKAANNNNVESKNRMQRITQKLATPKADTEVNEIDKTHQTVNVLEVSADQVERLPAQEETQKISAHDKIAMFRNRSLL